MNKKSLEEVQKHNKYNPHKTIHHINITAPENHISPLAFFEECKRSHNHTIKRSNFCKHITKYQKNTQSEGIAMKTQEKSVLTVMYKINSTDSTQSVKRQVAKLIQEPEVQAKIQKIAEKKVEKKAERYAKKLKEEIRKQEKEAIKKYEEEILRKKMLEELCKESENQSEQLSVSDETSSISGMDFSNKVTIKKAPLYHKSRKQNTEKQLLKKSSLIEVNEEDYGNIIKITKLDSESSIDAVENKNITSPTVTNGIRLVLNKIDEHSNAEQESTPAHTIEKQWRHIEGASSKKTDIDSTGEKKLGDALAVKLPTLSQELTTEHYQEHDEDISPRKKAHIQELGFIKGFLLDLAEDNVPCKNKKDLKAILDNPSNPLYCLEEETVAKINELTQQRKNLLIEKISKIEHFDTQKSFLHGLGDAIIGQAKSIIVKAVRNNLDENMSGKVERMVGDMFHKVHDHEQDHHKEALGATLEAQNTSNALNDE